MMKPTHLEREAFCIIIFILFSYVRISLLFTSGGDLSELKYNANM